MNTKKAGNNHIYFIAIILLLFSMMFTGCGNRSGTDSVSTTNYMNKDLEFYYFIPAKVMEDHLKQQPVLVCIPGLGGVGTEYRNSPFQDFAEKEGFILISPSFRFDEGNWERDASYQYPAVWSGQALIKIVQKIETKYNLHTGKILSLWFLGRCPVCSPFCRLETGS